MKQADAKVLFGFQRPEPGSSGYSDFLTMILLINRVFPYQPQVEQGRSWMTMRFDFKTGNILNVLDENHDGKVLSILFGFTVEEHRQVLNFIDDKEFVFLRPDSICHPSFLMHVAEKATIFGLEE